MSKHRRAAFTLVELSIVLVIIGLLVGGVLSGQSLIRAAELRAATSEYQRYYTAVKAFRDKYQGIPGDLTNATAFWGFQGGAGCTNKSGTAVTTPGVCDGDGNGQMYSNTAGQPGEAQQFWRQLALAGIIEGSYTGIAGTAQPYDSTAGVNVPKSKISNASWFAWYWNPIPAGDPAIFIGNYTNFFELGSPAVGGDPANGIFKPEELWNIDTKLDDGLPAQGAVVIRNWSSCTTATNNSQTSAAYLLSSSAQGCTAIFRNQF